MRGPRRAPSWEPHSASQHPAPTAGDGAYELPGLRSVAVSICEQGGPEGAAAVPLYLSTQEGFLRSLDFPTAGEPVPPGGRFQ